MAVDLDREVLLDELGYRAPGAQAAAVEVLAGAGLTNPRKTKIAAAKRDRCRAVLAAALVRLCERCLPGPDGDERRRVPVAEPTECELCEGSNNKLAVDRAISAFRRRGLRRLVVVGGSPSVHQELRALWPGDLELRIVDGRDRRQDRALARANVEWADVVIVWGSTVLDHRVSTLYTGQEGDGRRKVIAVGRRGVEALAEGVVRHLS